MQMALEACQTNKQTLLPNQQCHSTKGEKYHFPRSLAHSPQARLWVFQLCQWPVKADGAGLPSISVLFSCKIYMWCEAEMEPGLNLWPVTRPDLVAFDPVNRPGHWVPGVLNWEIILTTVCYQRILSARSL